MKFKIIVLSFIPLLFFLIGYIMFYKGAIITEMDYKEMVIEYGLKEQIYKKITINDPVVIQQIIHQINQSDRKRLDSISLEGFSEKDGRVKFKKDGKVLEFAHYYGTGNLVSESYLIITNIDFLNLK